MTRLFRALTIAALLFAASSATAQEPTQPTIGFGVGFQSLDIFTLQAAGPSRLAFYFPVNLGALKIEPAIGYWSYEQDGGSSQRGTSLGLGAFYQLKKLQQTSIYAGGRFTFVFEKQIPATETSITGNGLRFSVVAGGEHYLAPAFSIGAELQAGILKRGEQKQSGTVVEEDVTLFSTVGVAFLRYYFM